MFALVGPAVSNAGYGGNGIYRSIVGCMCIEVMLIDALINQTYSYRI